MVENSGNFGRLWRRVAGLGAFVLFVAGILVAVGLEELVILAVGVVALCGLAGALTLALARYRTQLKSAVAAGYRASAPVAGSLSRDARAIGRRLAAASWRAGRSTSLALAAALAKASRAGRTAATHGAPALQRADEELGTRVRAIAGSARRRASSAITVIAADIHAQRQTARSTRPRTRNEPRRRPRRAELARSPGDRRSAATRSAGEPPRDRA